MNLEAEKRPRVLLVVRSIILNSENKLLLIKRSENDSYAPGFWEIPGGKLDEGVDVSHAMENEALEETGLIVTAINKLSYVESQIVSEGKYQGLPYVLIVGVSRLSGGEIRLGSEHDASVWIPYEEALNYELKHDIKRALIALSGQFTETKRLGD